MINYQLSFLIAILAVVYTYILTQPNMLFNGIYNKFDRFFKTDQRRANGKGVHPVFMVLMYCHLCFSGQIALWLFLILNYKNYEVNFGYTLLQHILFVSFTIFCAGIFKNIYTKYIEHT